MARLWGVDGGRVLDQLGRFHPPGHRGLDVFARPGNSVVVPHNCTLQIVNTIFDPNLKGHAFGWIVMDGKRYGFVAAHMMDRPATGHFAAGVQYGRVAKDIIYKGTRRTPHIHFGLNTDEIPPPGNVDPYEAWLKAVGMSTRDIEPTSQEDIYAMAEFVNIECPYEELTIPGGDDGSTTDEG